MHISIQSKVLNFDHTLSNIKSSGFIFNYEQKKYIITVDHGYSISKLYIYIKVKNIKYKTNIYQQPVWNELLLLKVPHNILKNGQIYKKYRLKIPNMDEKLHLENNITFLYKGIEKIYLNMLPSNPKIIYLKVLIINSKYIPSYSGLPVLDKDNKIVGILSKMDSNYAYIIPIYFLIKVFKRNNNYGIYMPDIIESKIQKINTYNVVDKKIFHPSLSLKININTYFLIEGDENKTDLFLLKNIKEPEQIRYYNINSKLKICNEQNIIFNSNSLVKINSSLLLSLKQKNIPGQKICNILNIIMNNPKQEWFLSIRKKTIQLINNK